MSLSKEIEEYLSGWVPGQRWSRTATAPQGWEVRFSQSIDQGVQLLVVSPGGNPAERYFVPVTTSQPPRDAVPEPEFQQWLFQGFSSRKSPEQAQWLSANPAWRPPVPTEIKPLAPDSSNAVFAIDGQLLLKVFRMPPDGRNPEPELMAWLSEQGFEDMPEFFGTVCLEIEGEWCDLASVQRLLPGARDLWAKLLEDARAEVQQSEASPEEAWQLFGNDVVQLLEETAALLARFHSTTARGGAEPFGVRSIEHQDVLEWGRRLEEQRKLALERAELSSHPLANAAIEQASAPEIDLINDWPEEDPLGMMIRVHGDFHLGQVLHTDEGLKMIDFEGEPLRPRKERVRPDSPLRDVAGLLRSVDYLGATIGMEAPSELGEKATEWSSAMQSRVWQCYLRELEKCGGANTLPANPTLRERLLHLLLLEKGFYELRYEFLHRPDYVAVPLGGIFRLRGQPG